MKKCAGNGEGCVGTGGWREKEYAQSISHPLRSGELNRDV